MATLLPDAMVRRLLGARLGVILQQRGVSQLRSICLLLAIDPALLLGL
jgi:hypothetical protein